MKLRDVLGVLRDSYCRTVGVEYMHIMDPDAAALDPGAGRGHAREAAGRGAEVHPGPAERAEAFETFLQTKYIGQKRFSLEGGETVIALLDAALNKAAEYGMDEVVIGMAHRGRLNVLANIVGKPYSQIFREFEGNIDPGQAHGSGDVKYHLGAEGKYIRPFGDGQVDVTLVANPSPPRGRRPGAGGRRPRQAGPAQPGRAGLHRDADRVARRRRVRRPGRGRRDPAAVACSAATAPAAPCT